MTCKDCIHYDVCYNKPDHFDDLSVNGGCKYFSEKSQFIELPLEIVIPNKDGLTATCYDTDGNEYCLLLTDIWDDHQTEK